MSGKMRASSVYVFGIVCFFGTCFGYFDLEKAINAQTDPNNPSTDQMSVYPDFVNWRRKYGFNDPNQPRFQETRAYTIQGNIRGFTVPASYNDDTFIHVYLGVPYAYPPTKELRFEPPRAIPNNFRRSVYDASFYRPACPQPYEFMNRTIPGFSYTNEDCLYLNVFQPNSKASVESNRRYPVMVYIHGGMFKAGSAINYPGVILAQRDMIVVTIQYRLGPLGFITINEGSPCNLGLLDQKAALEWVKANIENFHGDPNKITIFGHEAGAASVGLQMISPLNRKSAGNELFHRAIMMSGSDTSQWAVIPKFAKLYTDELAKRVGCGGYLGLPDNLLSCLRGLHPDSLALTHIDLQRGDTAGPFAPMMDDFTGEPFINAMPRDIRSLSTYDAQVMDIPLLAGFNKDEGSDVLRRNFSYLLRELDYGVNKVQFHQVAHNVSLRRNAKDPNLVTDAIEFQYTYWSNPDNDTARRQMLVDIFTDEFAASGVDEVLKFHSRKTEKRLGSGVKAAKDSQFKAYMYKFDYRSPEENIHPDWMGADQESILRYLFGWPYLNQTYQDVSGIQLDANYTQLDRNISNGTMQMFKEFAVLGHPIPTQNNILPWNFQNLSWHPFKTNNVTYFEIDYNSTNEKEYHQSQFAFWRNYITEILRIDPFTTTPFFTTAYPYEGFQVATYALSGAVFILIIVVIALALVISSSRKGQPSINQSSYY